MTILTPPDRGQPIDVPYIYTMATKINEISQQLSESSEKYTTIFSRETGSDPLEQRTSDVKFYANFFDLDQQLQVNQGDTKDFRFDISGLGFKYPPIAVVTPVNTGTSSASNDVLVVITSTTNSEIRGFVRFNSAGTVDIAVNCIAIGVPV
jgi:hypothetical protein